MATIASILRERPNSSRRKPARCQVHLPPRHFWCTCARPRRFSASLVVVLIFIVSLNQALIATTGLAIVLIAPLQAANRLVSCFGNGGVAPAQEQTRRATSSASALISSSGILQSSPITSAAVNESPA